MESTDVYFVLRAKRELRFTHWATIAVLAAAVASWIASFFPIVHHDLARAVSFGALLGALLVNTDFSLYSGGRITRARLIAALEAQLNRDPEALKLMALAKIPRGA
jgi:hypothetical protein